MLLKQGNARVSKLNINEQHGVNVAGGNPIIDDRKLRGLIHGHAYQQGIIVFFQLGAKTGNKFHHVGFDGKQLRVVIQHQAHALRLRLGQRLCRAIRLPSQFVRDLQHLVSGHIGNTRLAVERIRNGATRDSRSLGNVKNRHLAFLNRHVRVLQFLYPKSQLKRFIYIIQ